MGVIREIDKRCREYRPGDKILLGPTLTHPGTTQLQSVAKYDQQNILTLYVQHRTYGMRLVYVRVSHTNTQINRNDMLVREDNRQQRVKCYTFLVITTWELILWSVI